MGRRWVRPGTVTALLVGVAIVAASVALPMIMLLHSDEETLSRWSQIGQALAAVGVFVSGVAFIGIATALLMQQRELANQHEELRIVQEEQRRSSEISLRQLHMDIIKMAINDRDLLSVWPPTGQGATRGKKDQYCNLILNLQKDGVRNWHIEITELRSALRYLMGSRDIYSFWSRARAARVAVTAGDTAEDQFTAEVDRAFDDVGSPATPGGRASAWKWVLAWRRGARPWLR